MPTALDGRNRHERAREEAVELCDPLHVAAEARRHAVRDDFEPAAQRVAGVAGAIDLRHHQALDGRVGDVQQRVGGNRPHTRERNRERIRDRHRTDRHDVARDLRADGAQQLTRDRADRDAGGRLARARALEHVPHVVVAVLHEAGEIRVSGPRTRDRRAIGA